MTTLSTYVNPTVQARSVDGACCLLGSFVVSYEIACEDVIISFTASEVAIIGNYMFYHMFYEVSDVLGMRL